MKEKKLRKLFLSTLIVGFFVLGLFSLKETSNNQNFRSFISKKPVNQNISTNNPIVSEKNQSRSIASVSSSKRSGGRVTTPTPYRPGLRAKHAINQKPNTLEISNSLAQRLVEGELFEMAGRDYVLLDNAFAVEDEFFDSTNQKLIKQLVGIKIVTSEQAPVTEFQRVVKTQDSNDYLVFTGKLKIKLINPDQAKELIVRAIEEHGFEGEEPRLSFEFEHFRVIVYIFKNYQDTMKFYNIVKASEFDDTVERINIDLIGNFRQE